uniref:WD repeat-containing protein on Y chromosome n=1 Tax=Knipowitschia caucasica TaxID=637954 RepID=A0AAV2K1P0_KNICA
MDNIKRDTMMPEEHYSSKQEKREKIREMERFFKEADKDGGGDLDETEFISAMGQFYPGHSEEELRALHMQIDANCDGTVDFNELLDFELGKHFAAKNRPFDNMFPLPIKIVDGGHHNKIVKIVARLVEKPEKNNNRRGPRKYIDEEYLTLTSDAKLKIWTDRFDKHTDEMIFVQSDSLPFQHKRRIKVNDLIYLKETEEVAVASNEREVRFYEWSSEGLTMRYSIIPEAGQVTSLHYWSDGTSSIFTFGDSVGYVFVCVSHHIHTYTLFNPTSFSRTKHDSYKRAYMTSLLQKTCPDFPVVKIKVFQEIVTSMKYIPALKEVVICGESATKMALVAANNERTPINYTNPWNAHKGGVTSITCNPSRENYITTGFDCNVTVWTKYEHLVGSFRKDRWEKKDLDPEWKKQSELESEADGLQLYDDQHLRFMQNKKADKKPSLGEEIHAARIQCEAFLSWAKYYQKQLTILTQTKKAEQVVQTEKVCEPRKIGHFMEKKIFQEPPLLRSYSGPTGTTPLTQYGSTQDNLDPSKTFTTDAFHKLPRAVKVLAKNTSR